MFEKKTEQYDPVTAVVPGVDSTRRNDEFMEQSLAGDPQPPKEIPNKEKIIFKKFGIKIIK